MKLKLPVLVLIFIALSFNIARADSYIVPDGNTLPEGGSPPTMNAAPTVAPTTNQDGYVEYDIVASKPPRINSTGISAQNIFNSKHGYVSDSDVKTYVSLLKTPDDETPECAPPTQTGQTISYYKIEEDGSKTYQPYNDAFCMNQGCVYFGVEGAERCE